MATKSGMQTMRDYASLNLAMARFARGDWVGLREDLGDPELAVDASNLPIRTAFTIQLDLATGEPGRLPWTRGERVIVDHPGAQAWQDLCEALLAREEGDAEAAALAVRAVEGLAAITGLGEDLSMMWPVAAEVVLDAGDAAALARMLRLTEEAGQRVPGALLAHRRWAEGAHAARDRPGLRWRRPRCATPSPGTTRGARRSTRPGPRHALRGGGRPGNATRRRRSWPSRPARCSARIGATAWLATRRLADRLAESGTHPERRTTVRSSRAEGRDPRRRGTTGGRRDRHRDGRSRRVRRARNGTRETGRTLASVFKNPNLRRVQLAFVGSSVGDGAYATAVTVWAYGQGGAAAVGIFQAVRFIAMAVAAPLGAVVADKVSRKTFMMVTDLVRAVLVLAATACIALGLSSLLVYALALLCAVVGAPFRSAQAGLIPQLARTPEELTASNATASNLENLALFAGPALGALLISVADVEVVFLLNAATFVVLDAAGRRDPRPGRAGPASRRRGGATTEDRGGFLAEVSAGFRTIVTNRDLGTVSVLAAAQGLVWGALTVFMVIMALDLLHAGPQGVGYLSSVMGVGHRGRRRGGAGPGRQEAGRPGHGPRRPRLGAAAARGRASSRRRPTAVAALAGDRAERPAGQPRPGHPPAAGGPRPGAVAGVRRPGVRARGSDGPRRVRGAAAGAPARLPALARRSSVR